MLFPLLTDTGFVYAEVNADEVGDRRCSQLLILPLNSSCFQVFWMFDDKKQSFKLLDFKTER